MASDETTLTLRRAECLRRYFEATGRTWAEGRNIPCPDAARHEHQRTDPTARIYEDANGARVKCHGGKCGGSWDIFALWGLDNGVDTSTKDGFKEAKAALCSMMGLAGGTPTRARTPHAQKEASAPRATTASAPAPVEDPDEETSAYLRNCFEDYFESDYLEKRGISSSTAMRFMIGYDTRESAIVIPYGAGYFIRYTAERTMRTGAKLRGMYLPKGARRPIFNAAAMGEAHRSGTPVFICEGEIDALSVIECGGVAVACPAGGERKFIEEAARIGGGVYVPLRDRDAAGDKSQARLESGLSEVNGAYVFKGAREMLMIDTDDGTHAKDANEELQRDRAGFAARVAAVAERARADALSALSPFNKERDGVLLRRFSDTPPTPPESEDQNALVKNYALAKGEGWVFAGEPGVGKSSFLIQFALFAAAGKEFFGFMFTRPLRVLYLQTELQERKLRQSQNSLQYAMRAVFGWTEEEIKRAFDNVFYDSLMIGNVCESVAEYSVKVYNQQPFDILIIDPLLTFAKDDLSLALPTRELLYEEITGTMGGRRYRTKDGKPIKFAVIIAHHMGKPKMDNGKRVERGQYATAGSYVINAWARFQLNLSRLAGNVFELYAAKNEECADWRDEAGNFTRTLYVKRAERGDRYWTLATSEEVTNAKNGVSEPARSVGRPKEERGVDFFIGQLVQHLKYVEESKTSLRKWCMRNKAFKGFNSDTAPGGKENPCKTAFESVTKNPIYYGLKYRTEKSRNGIMTEYFGGQPDLPGTDGSATDGNSAPSSEETYGETPDDTDL